MNIKIFYLFYNIALKNKFIRFFAVFICRCSSKIFFTFYFLSIIFLLLTNNSYTKAFIFVPFLTIAVNAFLRKGLNKSRPFQKLNIKPFIYHDSGYSFPSNHAAASMIIALSSFNINIYLGAAVTLFAVITSFSRIAAGLHFPFDIAAGWGLAVLFFLFGLRLF